MFPLAPLSPAADEDLASSAHTQADPTAPAATASSPDTAEARLLAQSLLL
jgi:hypothetical protein